MAETQNTTPLTAAVNDDATLDRVQRIAVVDAPTRQVATPTPSVVLDPSLTAPLQPMALTAPVQQLHKVGTPIVVFDEQRLQILTDTIMSGATPPELDLFKLVCERTGLDPFTRQIHAVKRSVKDGNRWVDRWSFQVAIDGFRLIAERTGKYRGQDLPLFCGRDGIWRDVWLEDENPLASLVAVLRADFDQPIKAVALWREYVQTKDEYVDDANGQGRKTGKKIPAAMWAKMPTIMLAKVAEALALRKAFPQELSGIYTDDEMAQAENGQPSAEDAERVQRRRQAPRQQAQRRTQAASPAAPPVDAPKATWTGKGPVFCLPPYREKGVAIDAVYDPGSKKLKKSKTKGQPDEIVECGGMFVVNDDRLTAAAKWIGEKFAKHKELETAGEVGGDGYLDAADYERFVEWSQDVSAEIERRAAILNTAAQHAAADTSTKPVDVDVSITVTNTLAAPGEDPQSIETAVVPMPAAIVQPEPTTDAPVKCAACDGSGGTSKKPCKPCLGTGTIVRSKQK